MKNNFFSAFINRLYKKNLGESNGFVWFSIATIIFVYIICHFRSPLLKHSFFRDRLIHDFVAEVQRTQTFDVQKFWQLRDQLGAVITYNPSSLEPQSILEFKLLPEESTTLFDYSAPGLVSKESLVIASEIESLVPAEIDGRVLYQDMSTLMYQENNADIIRIIQVQHFEEMQKHNGMIDYRELKQDLRNRLWLTSTEVTVSPNFDFDSH